MILGDGDKWIDQWRKIENTEREEDSSYWR